MNIEKFREVIKERNRISFLQNDCTADEYSWISEIIDTLAECSQSREIVQVYKNLMDKFSYECEIYNISDSIRFAENVLNNEADDGKD